MSISSSIVRKLGIWDWSEDPWDLARAYLLTRSVDTTNQRFEELSDKVGVIGEKQLDGPCRSPNHWDTHTESIYELEGGIWNGEQAWTVCRQQSCGSSSNLREHSNSYFGVMSAPKWQQNQTVYALIDEVSLMDSSGAGLGSRDSNVVVAGQVIVPHGAVTFSADIVISLAVSVALAEENTSLVFPGDSEIGLDLTTVVLGDGAWIYIFSVVRLELETFHLVSNRDALLLSSTGHVAWARPASTNVCAGTSKNRSRTS